MQKFKLPELPFAKDALKPFLSQEQIEYHYDKHHQAYVDKLNELLTSADGHWPPNVRLEELILRAEGTLFNQAAQAWNHTFYWYGLAPQEETFESGRLKSNIESAFGSVENLKSAFIEKGVGVFGSGWVWLIRDANGRLEVTTTGNADNPLRRRQLPLLTCDVWEHAYYIDFRNERKKYLTDFFQHINWRFVEENFSADRPVNLTKLMVD